jgi:multisubunit Na+/H+ antiporter MnhG subunit
MAFSNDATGTGRSLNQTLALTFGAVYALVGVIGFFVSSADGFAGDDGGKLLGIFGVNGLHNIVHLLIGVALIAASRTHAAARSTNLTIGAVYILLAVLGPFINNTALDIVALNGPDHVLHALSGVLLVGVAVAMDKNARTATV